MSIEEEPGVDEEEATVQKKMRRSPIELQVGQYTRVMESGYSKVRSCTVSRDAGIEVEHGFLVVFEAHRVLWDLRLPTALESQYLKVLLSTPMASTHVVDANGHHWVKVPDDDPPLLEIPVAAFVVAGLVFGFGASVDVDWERSGPPPSDLGVASSLISDYHANRYKRFTDVLAFLQYKHLGPTAAIEEPSFAIRKTLAYYEANCDAAGYPDGIHIQRVVDDLATLYNLTPHDVKVAVRLLVRQGHLNAIDDQHHNRPHPRAPNNNDYAS